MDGYKLITIGEVSKISGVHIKSLRYYDKIGILKPAYVDPETNYRYYTYSQIGIVDVIQTCVELDIPLKQFAGFMENDGQEIHYAQLLEYGKALAKKKVSSIRNGIKLIELLQQEISRSEALMHRRQPVVCEIPKKRYYTTPLDKRPSNDDFYNALGNLYSKAIGEGLMVGYEFGLLYIYRKGAVQRYQFIEIISGKAKSPCLITLPAGQYISRCIEQSKIETAPEDFSEQFANDDKKIVVESELLTGDYDISKPIYELRCSVSE